MKKLFLTIVAALTVSLAAQADNPYKKFTVPDNEVKLTDFGAVGDGIALNTEAFRKAIDALSLRGGGKLIVPQGVWHTGPIVLKSNIELHLRAGAVILFAADESLYPIIETSFEGLDTRRLQSPIYANGATNIAITGKGVIDGNGQYWRPVKKEKITAKHWKSLLAIPGSQELKPGYWVPSAGYAQGEKGANMNVPNAQTPEEWNAIKRFLRPVMISLVKCKNVSSTKCWCAIPVMLRMAMPSTLSHARTLLSSTPVSMLVTMASASRAVRMPTDVVVVFPARMWLSMAVPSSLVTAVSW